MPLVIGRSDLTGMCVAEQELRVQELMAAEAAAPFDLQAGPLLRVRLLECSAREHVLLVTLHHIVSDGWSMQVLVEEFVALYGSLASGHGPALAALPIQYADYAIWQRAWLEAGESERQLAYWQEKLGTEHAVLELPVDHARTSVRNDRGGSCRVRIDAALTARLRALGQAQQATLFMVLLAGFKGLLYRYTGAGEIRVGSPTANRTRGGDGRADRGVREHAGVEHGGRRAAELCGVAGAGSRDGAGGRRATRTCRLSSW